MKSLRSTVLLPVLAAVAFTSTIRAVDVQDTRLVSDPALSADRIAFAYANDLWVANFDGTGVRHLTSHRVLAIWTTPRVVRDRPHECKFAANGLYPPPADHSPKAGISRIPRAGCPCHNRVIARRPV